MQISLNGESCAVAPETCVATLLQQHGFAQKRVAVELNGEIVPRSQHAERQLREGDRVEIVQAIGGG